MKNYPNFKEYKPKKVPEGAPAGTRFFCDDNGNDWYHLMYELNGPEWKVGYLQDGCVVWATQNIVGTYSPAGLSVAVVDSVPTNQERTRDDIWYFEDGKVVDKANYK